MFNILKGGCNTSHPNTFVLSRPFGNDNYIFLSLKSPAIFVLDSVSHTVNPDTAIIIPPHTPYSYQNPNGNYIDDWLHFNIDATDIFERKSIELGKFFRVKDKEIITKYIRLILWESAYNTGKSAKDNQDMLMEILFNHLGESIKGKNSNTRYNPYSTKLQNIRISMRSAIYNPLTAEECSRILGLSKTRFLHLYTETFGISFQQDYIQMRIQYATNLLETTTMTMEQIAQSSGYSSEVHFYRQFQQHHGQTPAKYRKMFHNKSFS